MEQEKSVQDRNMKVEYSTDLTKWHQIPNSKFGPPQLRIWIDDSYIIFAVESDGSITIRSALTSPRMTVEPLASNSIRISATR
jgi:hypothetical protein